MGHTAERKKHARAGTSRRDAIDQRSILTWHRQGVALHPPAEQRCCMLVLREVDKHRIAVRRAAQPVSYTHLTLPTNREV